MSVNKSKAKSCFLNVDLDIKSTSKLDSLAAEMGKRVMVLYCGPEPRAPRYSLHVESSRCPKHPDATIHALCEVVENLSPAAKRIWNAAQKEFNVGYELRSTERVSTFSLRPDALQRIASLGAKLGVTYYRGEIADRD